MDLLELLKRLVGRQRAGSRGYSAPWGRIPRFNNSRRKSTCLQGCDHAGERDRRRRQMLKCQLQFERYDRPQNKWVPDIDRMMKLRAQV